MDPEKKPAMAPPLDIDAAQAQPARSVNVGLAGFTPKSVHQVPSAFPPTFSLDGGSPVGSPTAADGAAAPELGATHAKATRTHSSGSSGRQAVSDASVQRPSARRKSSNKGEWTGLRHSGSNSALNKAAAGGGGGGMPARRASSAPNLQALKRQTASSTREAERNVFRPLAVYYALDNVTIGTGGYAVVKKAVSVATGREYAVKIMPIGQQCFLSSSESEASDSDDSDDSDSGSELSAPDPLTFDEIMNEIELVQKLTHDNIVNIQEYFVNGSTCYIVRTSRDAQCFMQFGAIESTQMAAHRACVR